MSVGPAVSSRLALQRFFARTDFVTSKTSISRRSRPGSAAPFKGSRPDRLVFMLSTLSTSQAAKRGAHGNDISLASKALAAEGLGASIHQMRRCGCSTPLGIDTLPPALVLKRSAGQTEMNGYGEVKTLNWDSGGNPDCEPIQSSFGRIHRCQSYLLKSSAPGETRTPDPLLKRQEQKR